MPAFESLAHLKRHLKTGKKLSILADDPALLSDLFLCLERIDRPDISATFFGVFKAGKSTLLNAMIGHKLLPSGINRVTGIITKLRFTPEVSARVFFKDSKEPVDIQLDDVDQYIRLDTSSGGSIIPNSVGHVEIGLPEPRFSPNVLYIDTPGLRDTPELTKQVVKELAFADLAIMLVDATQIFGEEEQETAHHVNDLLEGNIIFVITKLEVIEEGLQEVVTWVESSLSNEGYGNDVVGKPRVFPVHSKHVLELRSNGAEESTDYNGLVQFENWLKDSLGTSTGIQIATQSRLSVVRYHLGELLQLCARKNEELSKPLNHLRQKHEDKKAKAQGKSLLRYRTATKLLKRYKNELISAQQSLQSEIVQNVMHLYDSKKDWQEEIGGAIEDSIAKFNNSVTGSVTNAASDVISVIKFSPQIELDGTTVSGNKSGLWGAVVGGVVLGWFVGPFGAVIGAATGRWLSKRVFGRDIRSELETKIDETAEEVASQLAEEAKKYVQKNMKNVQKAETRAVKNFNISPPDELVKTQAIYDQYKQLRLWCNELLNEANQQGIINAIIVKGGGD